MGDSNSITQEAYNCHKRKHEGQAKVEGCRRFLRKKNPKRIKRHGQESMNLCASSDSPLHWARQTQMTENTCVPSRTKRFSRLT